MITGFASWKILTGIPFYFKKLAGTISCGGQLYQKKGKFVLALILADR